MEGEREWERKGERGCERQGEMPGKREWGGEEEEAICRVELGAA
jgi:hypothetical protein